MGVRTTLNLDDDVANRLSELARKSGRSVSRVSNDVLRAGFAALSRPPKAAAYEPPVFDTGTPFVDVTDVAQALEVLDRG